MKTIAMTAGVTFSLIVLYGVFEVYQIFYSGYFNQTDFVDITFNSNTVPAKTEVLSWGFTNLKVIFSSIIAGIIITLLWNRYSRAK